MISNTIDITQCERLPNRAYNGANGKKRRIFYKVDLTARYEVLVYG